jgi:hypothetical protein
LLLQKQGLEKLNKELTELEQHMKDEQLLLLQDLTDSFAERVLLNNNIKMELEKRKLNELEKPTSAQKASELETLVKTLIDKNKKLERPEEPHDQNKELEEPPKQKSEQEKKENLKLLLKERKELIAKTVKKELDQLTRQIKELTELDERTSDQETELEKLNTDLNDQNKTLERLKKLKEQTKALEGELLETKQKQWSLLVAIWDEQLRAVVKLEGEKKELLEKLIKELKVLKTEVHKGTRVKDFRVLEKLSKELKGLEELAAWQKRELERLQKEWDEREKLEALHASNLANLQKQQQDAEDAGAATSAAGAATKEKVGEAWGTLLSVTKARAMFKEKLQGTSKMMKTIKVAPASETSEASEQVALQKLAKQMVSKPASALIALILRVEMPDKPELKIEEELEKLRAMEELEQKKQQRESRSQSAICLRKQISYTQAIIFACVSGQTQHHR